MSRGLLNFLRSCLRSFYPFAAAFAILTTPATSNASDTDPPGVLGYWIAESRKIAVEIYPCEERLCATIVWLAKPYRKNGEFKRDRKNPNRALRDRGWCGIEVIRGLKAKRANVWSRGKFYYPKRGETYDLEIKLLKGNRLELRAYLGIKLFGVTETWLRPEHGQTFACVPVPDS